MQRDNIYRARVVVPNDQLVDAESHLLQGIRLDTDKELVYEWIAYFDDGCEAVVGVFNGSTSKAPFARASLFDENQYELADTDKFDWVSGHWYLVVGDDVYHVCVVSDNLDEWDKWWMANTHLY
jgi:hypothetical protein